MSRRLHHATLLIFAVGLLVPAGLAAQDVVYTGCIKSADGSLYSVRQGTTPMAPCKAKDKQISWNMAGQPGPPGPAGPSVPQELSISVDCTNPGASINAALAQQAERLTISITGTCTESVYIGRDDVMLQGVGTNPTITAPAGVERAITIRGAQRVRLQGLTLTGGGAFTLEASNGASFTAYQLKISNPTGDGLWLYSGVAAYMQESEIAGCQGHGANVGESSLVLVDSQVIDNGRPGLFVQGSVLTLWGTNVARNFMGILVRNGRVVMGPSWNTACTILDNSALGIALGASHMYVDGCRIAGNSAAWSSAGISVSTGSVALMDNVIIEGNRGGGLYAQQGSVVQVGGASTVDGGTEAPGINLRDTCAANVSAGTSITGSPYGIVCAPPPSVAQLTSPVPNTVSTNCPTGQ
jgi:hypothetical protein